MATTSPPSMFNAHFIVPAGIISNHLLLVGILLFYAEVPTKFYYGTGIVAFLQVLGITAGYHRLWSHHAYDGHTVLKMFLQMIASASWQGSIRWWVLRHRMHHRFTDTRYDPYDATRGLWFSHFGWLFEPPHFYEKSAVIDMSDLSRDPVVEFNRRFYPAQVIVLGLLVPPVVGYLMGNAVAGFFWIGVVPRCISWNGIFFINSLAHYWGSKHYNIIQTATSHVITAFFSNGEGWHNYHHEFPTDYRHGVEWYQWDPTKWCIYLWYKLGLASRLVRADPHVVKECQLHTQIAHHEGQKQRAERELQNHLTGVSGRHLASPLPLPVEPNTLPELSEQQVKDIFKNPTQLARKEELMTNTAIPSSASFWASSHYSKAEGKVRPVAENALWIFIDGYVVDVTNFQSYHPGGRQLMRQYCLKDASQVIKGDKTKHTFAASRIMRRLRIAKLSNALVHTSDSKVPKIKATTVVSPATPKPSRCDSSDSFEDLKQPDSEDELIGIWS